MSKLIIGVTDCSKYLNYSNWIEAASTDIITVKLSGKEDYESELARCNAIVFTGGEDVHPAFYKKPEFLPYCNAHDISMPKKNSYQFLAFAVVCNSSMYTMGELSSRIYQPGENTTIRN